MTCAPEAAPAWLEQAEASLEDAPTTILFRDARLIDGTGAAPMLHADVLVEDGRIAAIGSPLPIPSDAWVIELAGRTLLPGFVDAHVHLSYAPAPSYAELVRRDVQETAADRALRGAAHARATLWAGFTTVRNVGGSEADRALRDAIVRGDIPGPRMLVANAEIGTTGGHCDETNGMAIDVVPPGERYRVGIADGVDEVRKAVRHQIQRGADLIKVCVTGGVTSPRDRAGASQLVGEELRAAVDEAHRAGLRVAAHAHGTEGIREAVQAGVESIEHGSMLDADTVALMKTAGTVLVPTLYVAAVLEAQAQAGTLPPGSASKAREVGPRLRQSFRLALREGISIVLGSDAGVFPHGHNGREFAALVEQGMSPMAAIVAGTSAGADLLGLADVGRVVPGAWADLVVVEGDPLTDPRVLEEPAMVMKGGVVHRQPPWMITPEDLSRPPVPSPL